MQASPNREQMGAYVRQAAIELLEGAAPAGPDPRQAGCRQGWAAERASQQHDPRKLLSRVEIVHLLD